MSDRVKLAVRRGLARGDTWVAIVALWFSGYLAADGTWLGAAVLGLAGLVFVVASGDYCWRRGYVAAGREGGATGPGPRR